MRYLNEEPNDVKIGLEIHFQVKGRKLFCECNGEESNSEVGKFKRRLVVVSGERAEKDVAALQESIKRKEYEYIQTDNSCLVEMDEEPPHLPGRETLETAIIVSLILGCRIVDNVHFMRKIVIDGSNTSGFQRTGIVGLHGSFKTDSKNIGIASVTLEEEACKKVKEDERRVVYSLDRLGIPLIEISTDPDIRSPREARVVAQSIGLAVKQSGMIRREASSIRQDLNVSIRGGNRVEIKGVQSLSQIEKVLAKEIERQESLIEIADILRKRNANGEILLEEMTSSDLIRNSDLLMKGVKSGQKVYGFSLPGLSGLLNNGKYRLGREIAERLKAVGIGGFIHSDELPNYGIDEKQKQQIFKKLTAEKNDAFGLVALESSKIELCMEIIQSRVRESLMGVPAETRGATENGTRFLRPLSGGSRMYPETDIPLISLDSAYLNDVKRKVPPTVHQKIEHLESLGIPRQEAFNSLWKEYDDVLESFVNEFGNPKVCAKFLSVVYSSDSPDINKAEELMKRFSNGNIPSEALESLYLDGEFKISANKKIVLKRGNSSALSLLMIENGESREINSEFKIKNESNELLGRLIERIVNENESLIKERGESSFKLLMGRVMDEVRGQFSGKEIATLLNEKIKETIRKH